MSNEIMVNIDELKQSVSNVRAKHSKEDIEMMAHSIKHRGIINPPAVAKNGDGKYEVVAGFLRTLGAAKAGVKQVRCLDVSVLTDSERVEMSLSENIDRRNMTAIQYFHAFHQLFKAGMAVPKIGERFNKTEREVQQLLAIGSLPKKILALAENDEIGDRTLKALAIASGKDVTRYAKLSAKERPADWKIQEWLAGNDGMYLEANAIFDIDKYKGPKIIDLFAEENETYLTDGAQFMELQRAAIKKKLEDYKAKKWDIQEVEHFQAWLYERTAKKKGGKLVWCMNPQTGEVQFHAGYKLIAKGGKDTTKKKDKPAKAADTSKAFDQFMAQTRHKAVQFQLANDTLDGMVGTVVLLLKQADNISFRYNNPSMSDAYNESMHGSSYALSLKNDWLDMLKDLGIKDGSLWDIKVPQLVKKLNNKTNTQLVKMINLIVAYNWSRQTSISDELGKAIGLKEVNVWEADDAFWNGIKNKNTLIKIAKETGVPIDEKATTKIIRSLLKEKCSNNWRPTWLQF